MKPKRFALTVAGCAALAAAAFFPARSTGQAPGADDAQVQQLILDVAAQQKILGENQTKLEEKAAAIAEEVRLARIFAGRAGGKVK